MAAINPQLNPSSLLRNEQFMHATCGMSKETVSILRNSAREDKLNNSISLCQNLAQTLVNKLSQLQAAVIIAPPVGPIICFSLNNDQEILNLNINNLDVLIWLLLDPTDIDSKQTTFININLQSNSKELMKTLYRLTPTENILNLNSTPKGRKQNSLQEIKEDNEDNEDDKLVAFDHNGRQIDQEELKMLESANMLKTITWKKVSSSSSSEQHLNQDDEIEDFKSWLEKVKELIHRPKYHTERPLPCLIIPGLYLSSIKEAISSETLLANEITNIFSCIESAHPDSDNERRTFLDSFHQSSQKARNKANEANLKSFCGISSEDESDYQMLDLHYKTFEEFVKPLINSCDHDVEDHVKDKQADKQADITNNRVLVHCVAGVNRSGLLVVAYVMRTLRLPILKALEICLEARGPLLWNTGFQEQLVRFAHKEGLLIP